MAMHPTRSGLVWTLRLGVAVGIAATVYYFTWWSSADAFVSPILLCGLLFAAMFYWSQLLSAWVLYLAAEPRRDAPPLDSRTWCPVDVYLTACGETPGMVERSLAAAIAMRGEHATWLLDDGDDPRLESLARRLGAGYLTRPGNDRAKAGNINAALPRTTGEVIAIFDIDHVPEPGFLERSLGWFSDRHIGFVQVMLTFRNSTASWVARAATETAMDFYNATCLGMERLGGVTLIGSNALIRRRALASIGGYRPGLAEDLATSIALHARGWRSRYVAEPLAPGLSPIDLRGWFVQQAKWARGVFEVLLTDYPRLFTRLTWGQRMCYVVRMTYYWIGPVIAIHCAVTLLVLLGPDGLLRFDYYSYLLHVWPLFLCDQAIRRIALLAHRHDSVRPGLLWRGAALTFSTWPIYSAEWVRALLRRPMIFRATPKLPSLAAAIPLTPQTASVLLLAVAAVVGFISDRSGASFAASFALAQIAPVAVVLVRGGRSRPPRHRTVAIFRGRLEESEISTSELST